MRTLLFLIGFCCDTACCDVECSGVLERLVTDLHGNVTTRASRAAPGDAWTERVAEPRDWPIFATFERVSHTEREEQGWRMGKAGLETPA